MALIPGAAVSEWIIAQDTGAEPGYLEDCKKGRRHGMVGGH